MHPEHPSISALLCGLMVEEIDDTLGSEHNLAKTSMADSVPSNALWYYCMEMVLELPMSGLI